MSFTHRPALQADLPAIVAIYNATIAGRIATADTEPVSVASRQAWFDVHSAARRPIWVCEVAGEIAGWLSFSDFYGRPAYSGTAELSIYVHADHRGRGLARYLLQQAIAAAPALHVHTLLGFIFGHNAASLALFAQHGFGRWGELPHVAVLDGIERDLLILGLRLD
ncbi:putative phosphinothricin acetyltransferase YwnH [Andreprevotia sp. IGB-42]|uniref:GNAT family N-acetyltransferase n=1 Tax=Andreprevotia sp. IGB-42 TaxID=2497473 RepID=UPI00135B43C8|nr:GNAT family N-acetyltransferase [Andreprevotia sp. IGB-42]KAF0812029.1 putative phosphinothricin acetyltransferase YwnH [Andreprevotia sp. IGB-42]